MKGFSKSELARQIVVDVEASGPIPRRYGLLQIGAVFLHGPEFKVNVNLPDEVCIDSGAMASIGLTREDVRNWGVSQKEAARLFYDWIVENRGAPRVYMWSDNPAFDWQWINDLFWTYKPDNPLGHSARRIGDFYAGIKNNVGRTSDWKRFRRTKHTHDALEDARGNAEALLKLTRNEE